MPDDEVIEAGGFELMPDGKLAVCDRRGDVWMVDEPMAETVPASAFKRFARGLHEPLS